MDHPHKDPSISGRDIRAVLGRQDRTNGQHIRASQRHTDANHRRQEGHRRKVGDVMNTKQCPQCDGEGQCEYEFYDFQERKAQCEECNGSGTVEDDREEDEIDF